MSFYKWRRIFTSLYDKVAPDYTQLGLLIAAYVKKGALIKSYRYSHALITPRFTMWKQIDLYLHLRFLYLLRITAHHNKCVNLYLGNVKIYLIRILCQSTAHRCVKTATIRCVFKIYNVTRFAAAKHIRLKIASYLILAWSTKKRCSSVPPLDSFRNRKSAHIEPLKFPAFLGIGIELGFG